MVPTEASKTDILAIAIHPDDIELSCSGTLLSHLDQGYTVGLLELTRGELGTRGTPEIRKREALDAAEKMGASFRVFLDLEDGFFQYDRASIEKIIRVIRSCNPDVVLTNAPRDRHPDHGRAARLTADACFYSGLSKIETHDAQGNLQARWRPKGVYHYIQDYNLEPDLIVDITGFMDEKIELVQAFRSQFFVPGDEEFAEEQNTPISGQEFIAYLRAKARTYGRTAGFEFGEGFIASRTPGVKDLLSLR